ncbi:2,3-bisphosphoglycerate-independent phosphoglycerate mutase [Candidatus Nanohalococcus occultus]|uniref:2,3-bisphosphoglycerate-independent phosphoglycerate mutase n=1 Tax=Candidatus Nanohalococcus occultus TaxID=2978047 RepID=UPI0039E053B1
MEPVVLVVMDGVGLREEKQGNAFKQADTPTLDSLMETGFQRLEASGPAVGLPEGYTGNSEVGHLHMGAGRRTPQRLTRINESVESNELQNNSGLVQALERAEKNDTTVHFAGIISDGGIHGHIDHLEALMEAASDYDVKVRIHCFTDGRDVDPKSAEKYLEKVGEFCDLYGGEIATVMGRFYSMDRDSNWERTEKAYRAMTAGEGFEFSEPAEAVEKCYGNGDYDYFIQPSVAESYEGMKDDEEVVFYNFRADRERQIADALIKEDFSEFEAPIKPNFTSMFRYREEFDNPVLFEKQVVENTLGEKIQAAGLSQLRVAESQKKPHVTYFFNGQRELEFEDEDRKFIESDKIKAYDQKPEMHAEQTTDIVLDAIEHSEYDFILLNYANGDLVGHTGDLEASITAVETVDRNLGRLVEAVKDSDYRMVVTADHGNCEDLGTSDESKTSHTLNPVPLIGVDLEFGKEYSELWEVENIISSELSLEAKK